MYRNGRKPQLSNTNLDSIFTLSENLDLDTRCDEDRIIHHMASMCNTSTPDGWRDEKESIVNELQKYEIKEVIRGKFELWIFIKFFNKLPEVLSKTDVSFNQNTIINNSNAVEVLGPRIESLTRLEKYLEDRLT